MLIVFLVVPPGRFEISFFREETFPKYRIFSGLPFNERSSVYSSDYSPRALRRALITWFPLGSGSFWLREVDLEAMFACIRFLRSPMNGEGLRFWLRYLERSTFFSSYGSIVAQALGSCEIRMWKSNSLETCLLKRICLSGQSRLWVTLFIWSIALLIGLSRLWVTLFIFSLDVLTLKVFDLEPDLLLITFVPNLKSLFLEADLDLLKSTYWTFSSLEI